MTDNATTVTSRQIKETTVKALEDKKAFDVVAIDVDSVTVIADSFVICSGMSTTHIKALADEVEKALRDAFGLTPKSREGYNSARWILLDYGDVLVHVFHEQDRRYYDLERLWSDGVVTYRGDAAQ